MDNSEIRANLLKYGREFISSNCQYNNKENEAVEEMLQDVQQPVGEYERYNERHPDHGKKEEVY